MNFENHKKMINDLEMKVLQLNESDELEEKAKLIADIKELFNKPLIKQVCKVIRLNLENNKIQQEQCEEKILSEYDNCEAYFREHSKSPAVLYSLDLGNREPGVESSVKLP